jgi:uncharacterized protein (TIGR02246 family)
MKTIFLVLVVAFALPNTAYSQSSDDTAAVLAVFESWNEGWAEADATLAVQDYADDADWTNAFGDRIQGRDALRKKLQHIFNLDFVMAGDTGGNEYADVIFLSPDVALIRSKLVRTGQQTSTGATMPDRHINHLRVLRRQSGTWQIVSHLISQAKEKS